MQSIRRAITRNVRNINYDKSRHYWSNSGIDHTVVEFAGCFDASACSNVPFRIPIRGSQTFYFN